MKKLIIISVISLIVLNVVAKLIFTGYELFNMILVTSSILSSGVLMYCLYAGKINDAYRIGLSFLYFFTLPVKAIISFLSPSMIENNYYFPVFISIILIETIFLLIVRYMRKHA